MAHIEIHYPAKNADVPRTFVAHGLFLEGGDPNSVVAVIMGEHFCCVGQRVFFPSNRWAFYFHSLPVGDAFFATVCYVGDRSKVKLDKRPIRIVDQTHSLTLTTPSMNGETLFRDSNGRVLVAGFTSATSASIDQPNTRLGAAAPCVPILKEPFQNPPGDFYIEFQVDKGIYDLTVQDTSGASDSKSEIQVV